MCLINLKDPIGLGNPPTQIWIRGSVEDCDVTFDTMEQLTVGVSCTGSAGPFTEVKLVAHSSGSWEAVLPVSECGCGDISDNPLFVRVICQSDDSCTVLQSFNTLVCGDCPKIVFGDKSFDDVDPDPTIECLNDGTGSAALSFNVTVLNGTSEDHFIRLSVDPPTAGTITPAAPELVPAGTNLLIAVSGLMNTPINNTRIVASVEDAGGQEIECPPLYVDLVDFPCCEPPRFVTPAQIDINGCTVTIQGEVDPPTSDCLYNWKFGECLQQGDCTSLADDEVQTPTPNVTFIYKNPGTYTVTLSVRCRDCVTLTTFEVEILSCEPDDDGGGNGDGDGSDEDDNGDGASFWCIFTGIMLGLLIAVYIIGIGLGIFADISQALQNLVNLSAGSLIGVVGASIAALMLIYADYCGLCSLGRAVFWGGLLGLTAIIGIAFAGLIFGGPPVPNFWSAVIVGVVFIVAGWITISEKCDSFI